MKNAPFLPFPPTEPFDHAAMMQALERLYHANPVFDFQYLGSSILGRGIPLLSIGSGTRALLYVGAHHGMEWITSCLLVRFLEELCLAASESATEYNQSVSLLLQTRRLYFIPMLNPDGVEYQIHGVQKDNPLLERLLAANADSTDFSHWQANARGVDLNHNYDAGFEEYKAWEQENGIYNAAPTRFAGNAPESEPETHALCNFIRFHEELCGVLTLHTQGEEIYYTNRGKAPARAEAIVQRLARMSGYKPSVADGPAAYGGLTDWCVESQKLCSFTLECGLGTNPLPLSDAPSIYARLRRLFFLFPTLL